MELPNRQVHRSHGKQGKRVHFDHNDQEHGVEDDLNEP